MKTNGQIVQRGDLIHLGAAWEEIRMAARKWKDRAWRSDRLPVAILYAANLILLTLILYGMYHGLHTSIW